MTTTECTDVQVIEIHVDDSLDVSTLEAFATRMDEAVDLRPARLVVDLSQCSYLYAQAIRILLQAHREIWLLGGRLVLRGCNADTVRLLDLVGVLDVFELESGESLAEWARSQVEVTA